MKKLLILFLALLHVWTSTAYALDLGIGVPEKMQGPNLTSEYIYRNSAEEALIPVYLLGAVAKPGLYHVPGNMDVLGLLTVAGGTLADAELDHVLVRSQSQAKNPKLVNFDLNQMVKGGEAQRVGLSTNDLIYVTPGHAPQNTTGTVLTAITIVTGILSIVATSILIKQAIRN